MDPCPVPRPASISSPIPRGAACSAVSITLSQVGRVERCFPASQYREEAECLRSSFVGVLLWISRLMYQKRKEDRGEGENRREEGRKVGNASCWMRLTSRDRRFGTYLLVAGTKVGAGTGSKRWAGKERIEERDGTIWCRFVCYE